MRKKFSLLRPKAALLPFRVHEQQVIEPILQATGHKIGRSDAKSEREAEANSLKINGGPARIRTWDQRIMRLLIFRRNT
jgi:hypothetical protein